MIEEASFLDLYKPYRKKAEEMFPGKKIEHIVSCYYGSRYDGDIYLVIDPDRYKTPKTDNQIEYLTDIGVLALLCSRF